MEKDAILKRMEAKIWLILLLPLHFAPAYPIVRLKEGNVLVVLSSSCVGGTYRSSLPYVAVRGGVDWLFCKTMSSIICSDDMQEEAIIREAIAGEKIGIVHFRGMERKIFGMDRLWKSAYLRSVQKNRQKWHRASATIRIYWWNHRIKWVSLP